MVDIDGVISLFGTQQPGARTPSPHRAPAADPGAVEGSLQSIDGTPHFLSATAARQLLALSRVFDLVWASGWEEKANEHLPHLLGLPAQLPFVRFSQLTGQARSTHAHWKLEAIEAYAGQRALAWVDDAFNPACQDWARTRPAPTLLVSTAPERGLTPLEAEVLMGWARALGQR